VSGVLLARFSQALAYRQPNLATNGKQGLVPEEIFQTLLTNKNQGKIAPCDATNLIKPALLCINRKKIYFYFNIKLSSPPKKF
jgi:hypothetical protein